MSFKLMECLCLFLVVEIAGLCKTIYFAHEKQVFNASVKVKEIHIVIRKIDKNKLKLMQLKERKVEEEMEFLLLPYF